MRQGSLSDTRGQDASKEPLRGLSETVYFKGSFQTETFLCSASISLVTGSLLKWHTEQGVISHGAVRLKSTVNASLKIGEVREKEVCFIKQNENCHFFKKARQKVTFKS